MKCTRRQSPELLAKRRALAAELFPAGAAHPAAKYDDAVREKVVRMYRAFAPVRQIMAETGCSRDTIDRYRRAAGLRRNRSPVDPGKWKPGYEMVNGKPTYAGG